MKTLAGIALAFVIGIAVTASILPKLTQDEPKPAPNIESVVQTEAALTGKEPLVPEPQATVEIKAVEEEKAAVEVAEPLEVKAEVTTSPEPEKVVVEAETAPKQTSPPQVTPTQPETWWEDGKQYTMINGHKAYIAPEGNNQLGYYDWENDPLKDVPGPFNGNGN